MTIEVRDVDDKKMVEKFFDEELPAVGVRGERDIFKCAVKLSWPMPPQPIREGKFIRWREYGSVVVWADRAISMLMRVGGAARVREAVLACRLQEQVDRLVFDLREILLEVEGSAPKIETPTMEEQDGT